MVTLFRWHKGVQYWLYDTYNNKREAIQEGIRWKKKIRKNKFIIITYQVGIWDKTYALYMNKKLKLC